MSSPWEIQRSGMFAHDMLCADVRSDGRYILQHGCHAAKLPPHHGMVFQVSILASSASAFSSSTLRSFLPYFLPSFRVPGPNIIVRVRRFLFCIRGVGGFCSFYVAMPLEHPKGKGLRKASGHHNRWTCLQRYLCGAMAWVKWLRTASPLPHAVLRSGLPGGSIPPLSWNWHLLGALGPSGWRSDQVWHYEREVRWLLPTTSLLIALGGSPGITAVVSDRLRFDSS
jgi:hypothetical protein